ncbi:MAG: nucleotidyl transferase AbiEii/AbiGii toxin family protein [Tannerella sp.]|jgi:predicted nucleotidyltransferase component of viral defense system|nr:nucleotidyl transferase AbiEii/AbiGii toxin family protein [Tannerella sp.]
MMDINKHKFYLAQLLKDIYSDTEIACCLGFKGGTALMFFYELPRFSVDLDFNLLLPEKNEQVYQKVRKILLKQGKIHDEAQKFYRNIFVLDYGVAERKLKVEISNRQYNDAYEIKNLLGINMKVMTLSHMFSHKLCALLDRNSLANRDIFDCWFFMNRQTPINKFIVENRMDKPLAAYLQNCIEAIENLPNKSLLDGIGELVNPELKTFIRNKLRTEMLTLLRFYKEFPITV